MCHRMAKLVEMEKIKMVAVKTDRRIATAMMEVHANVYDVWYEERALEDSPLWYCSECGLLWDRQWQADQCGEGTYQECAPLKNVKRNHRSSFPQHYGGGVENDVYKPAATYIRQSYGRVKIK